MRKIKVILVSVAMLAMQPIFANHHTKDKSCAAIADACLAAGFARTESANKNFWHDCMQPIVLGKTVSGVSIDASVAKACRTSKIKKLKKELKTLENANKS